MLYDMIKPGIDPLGSENVLGFVTGPLTATGALFSGRYMVVCKSPVTGAWNDANSGGFFGPELKKAGYIWCFVLTISIVLGLTTPIRDPINSSRRSKDEFNI